MKLPLFRTCRYLTRHSGLDPESMPYRKLRTPPAKIFGAIRLPSFNNAGAHAVNHNRTQQGPTIKHIHAIPERPGRITLVPSQFILQTQIVAGAETCAPGESFPAPSCFVFSQWVRDSSYHADLLNGQPAAHTPDKQQIRALWAQSIQALLPDVEARECHALAKQARDADRLISQWLDEPERQDGGSSWRAFLDWRARAHRQLQHNNWFSPEDWLVHFSKQLLDGMVAPSLLPERIDLCGFVETTRLENRLFEALEHAGVRLEHLALPGQTAQAISVRHFETLEHELSCMAEWASTAMQNGNRRIAVVINNLGGIRDKVARVFEDTFHPDHVLGMAGFDDGDFHISHKPHLGSHPLVATALDLLQASCMGSSRRLEFPLLSRLLLGGGWHGAPEERFARASLELSLRERGWYHWSLAGIADLGTKHPLHASLTVLLDRFTGLPPADGSQTPAEQLLAWLAHWGWPGDNDLDKASTGAVNQLLACLESLATQSFTGVTECLGQLRQACEENTINLHGGAFSPVQIMSPGEAYGQQFELAWAGNLNDGNWPGRAMANPFIPTNQMAGVPRGTDSGMLQYADELMDGLKSCANEVIFSAARRYQDVPQLVSPLLDEIGVEAIEVKAPARGDVLVSLLAAPAAGQISRYASHPWLKPHTSTAGLRLAAEGSGHLRAAVKRFNFQSACPLASYMVFRLFARMHDHPSPFVDAAYRGSLMHAAMEHLYRRYTGSDATPAANDVPAAVDAALEAGLAAARLFPAALKAEKARLENLLCAWLKDTGVKPGGRPLELEWRRTLTFASFELDVRIDRMDRLENGRVFIIDYKSGNPGAISSWARSRPGNIQLPLYAVSLDQGGAVRPAGVALVSVKLGDFKALGISDDAAAVCKGVQLTGSGRGSLAGQFEDWTAVLDFWRSALNRLADEIRNGECRHQMYDPDALAYADLDILLRESELTQWCLENDAAGDNGDDRP